MSSELCLSSELISGFPSGLEICPVQHSNLVKCFTVFTPCHSSAWHAWGPHCCNCSLRAALPAAELCSTAFTILCQETNCFHYCPASDPTGLIFSFSILRYSQCHTYLLQSMELTAIILAHGPTAPSIWDYLRSVPPNILNGCTGAALRSSSHRQGPCWPCCPGCCTYRSVGHGSRFFIQYFCLTTSDKGGCSNSVANHLYATMSNSLRHSRQIYLEFSFRDYSTCQFFLCSLDSLVVPPKSIFILGGRRG